MKKIILIPLLLIISFSSFVLYNFFTSSSNYLKTYRYLPSASYKVPVGLIEELNKPEAEEAKSHLIRITLKVINYNTWEDFINYIDVKVYKEKILPIDTEQLVVILNLSKDISVAVVFVLMGDEYLYHSHIENLVPVEKVEFLSIPSQTHKMLLVYQVLDEEFGGFFYEEFVDIYYYIVDDFKRVWQKTLYYEEIYNEGWLSPEGSKNTWNKVIEETAINFVTNDKIKVNSITSLHKYTANSSTFPTEDDFILTENKTFKQSYYWSHEFNYFILGEVSQSVFKHKTAVIEDSQDNLKFFYNINNQNYRLINTNGEVFYLPKKSLKGMFETLYQ
ncbi:hypothetical protein F8154_01155 [Alkaliphilus pronyensis]|uniref:Uncharacterized protein n=1 Tax=Alkaliphilus pronyensis TaxID=1482732 RepID=A0A6I0FJY8_9FIRM|nr:hypothetical protein [Alkaliphilus pronyensis]KAB3539069.1 hypothetical protein F8154_01155 [Alkaliphilus pronyensis]